MWIGCGNMVPKMLAWWAIPVGVSPSPNWKEPFAESLGFSFGDGFKVLADFFRQHSDFR